MAVEASAIAGEAVIRRNSRNFDEIRCFGRVWKASGGIWEASGRHVEAYWRHWEAPRLHLEASGTPWGRPRGRALGR